MKLSQSVGIALDFLYIALVSFCTYHSMKFTSIAFFEFQLSSKRN